MNRILLYPCCVLLLLPSLAFAQTPVEVTQQLIKQMQGKQNLEPVVEHIDWKGAYDAMDPEERQQMGIKSAEDLKTIQVEGYNGMGDRMKQSVSKAMLKVPPEKAAILKIMQERLVQSMAEQQEQNLKDFNETAFSVGKSTVNDTTAQVEIIKRRGDSVITSTIDYVKVDGVWKLKSAAPLSPTAARAPGEAANLLGPSIASPDQAMVRFY